MTIPSSEPIYDPNAALQQFILAFAACLLCLFLMFRNKERILTRSFQSRNYVNIEDSNDEAGILMELTEINDIGHMEDPEVDAEDEDAKNEDTKNEV